MTETLVDRLAQALDSALRFNPAEADAPIALLWPDEHRQWESIIPALQQRRRVVGYGEYDPEGRQGPAYWLRCVIVGALPLDDAPDGIPIVYLPGISRSHLRSIKEAPAEVVPLASLQHRSLWFTHMNGKDWSVRALLSDPDRGLGLNVAGDEATAAALPKSLGHLANQQVSSLEAHYINAPFLNNLVNPDPVRSILSWLDDPSAARERPGQAGWSAFVDQCQVDYGVDPERDGELAGARRLGEAEGAWAEVWRRFRESPSDFPGIVDRLRAAEPEELFPKPAGAWPSRAAEAEDSLRIALSALADEPVGAARQRILELEAEHKERRGHVWADLGHTPVVLALEHLAEVARLTPNGPAGTTVDDIAGWYATEGWRVDRSVLAALNEVDAKADLNPVAAALTATYRPWLDLHARSLQAAVGTAANAGTYVATAAPMTAAGDVVVFIDGLRLDVAHLLADQLEGGGATAPLSTGFAALPTVTQNSKPVLVPVDQSVFVAGDGLAARRGDDGPAAGVSVLRGLLNQAGVQVLGPNDLGDPTGVAWTETGELDHLGHSQGLRFVQVIGEQVQRISRRIEELLDNGWQRVTVVTDHGWLLLPGGLPKNDQLPVALTEAKKGRCARLKVGATTDLPTVPWHWDPNTRIAAAPGISCFEANQEYEHGGVSPQECVVPRLVVTRSGSSMQTNAAITKAQWRGLMLRVEFAELPDGATVDLRTEAGDPGSSIAEMARITGGQGKVLLLVEDDDLEGVPAHLVIVASDGTLLQSRPTTVGQNR